MIELNCVTKIYAGDKLALSDISCEIKKGKTTAIIGKNGAGKTTLMNLILGFDKPTKGFLKIEQNNKIAAVLQKDGLIEDYTVKETINIFSEINSKPLEFNELNKFVKIDSLLNKKIKSCSGGERQIVRFAISLISNADILILDEPTVGLDVFRRDLFWNSITQLKSLGKTVVFSSHYLDEAQKFADNILFLNKGSLLFNGKMNKFFSSYSSGKEISFIPKDKTYEYKKIKNVNRIIETGDRIILETDNPDELLNYLVENQLGSNIEIKSLSLENVFKRIVSEINYDGI